MTKELCVSVERDILNIALLEDERLMEFQQAESEQKFAVGDLYLGKVKKLAPSLNAMFVDIGFKKDAFLHYHDLSPQFNSLCNYVNLVRAGKFRTHNLKTFRRQPDIDKNGTIDQVAKAGDTILVQIAKEPISTKGPRLTSEISIAGRHLVLTPFMDKISISQKIRDKNERKRLLDIIGDIKPEGFGLIIRTVAQNVDEESFKEDLNYLMNQWVYIYKNLRSKKVPIRVWSEMNRASSILRDSFSKEFSKITVDDEELADEIKSYLTKIAPEKSKIVNTYQSKTVPLFEKKGIERQIKQSFGKVVNIPNSNGAYLVIEHTEALHVVDVNSGNINKQKANQEESALEVNKRAAAELARQLRLRDMGGIVVVDFIDMRKSANKKELYEYLKAEMNKDKAKHKVLPPSRFSLIQITRQRVRPEMAIKTREENPNPSGTVEAPILIISKMEAKLKQIASDKNNKKIFLHVHPFVAAYLKQGLPSIRQKWFKRHKRWVKIVPRDSYKYLQFNFLNDKGQTYYNESN